MTRFGKISACMILIATSVWFLDLSNAARPNIRSKRSPDDSTIRKRAFYYTSQLFRRFGQFADDEESVLDMDSLKSVVFKMGLGEMYGASNDGHDHGDHEGHDHDEHAGHNHDHDHHEGHDHDHHEGHNHEGHDHDHHEGHDHDHHEGHDHDHHEGHDHRRKRNAENSTADAGLEQPEPEEKCSNIDGLLSEYTLNGISELYREDFLFLCPALVDQLVSGACDNGHDHDDHDHHHDHDHDHQVNGSETGDEDEDRNMGLVWFYLMFAVTIISLCAVWGILCIPSRSKSAYELVIHFLMAMGAGSMAGDALLHLLPHALMPPHDHSAHGHEGHDHSGHDHSGHDGHDHGDHTGEGHGDHGDEHMEALLKGLVALIGLYSFFALERLFSIFLARSASKSNGHAAKVVGLHSHGEPLEDVKFLPASTSNNTNLTDLSPSPLEHNEKTHHWPHAHGENGLNGDAHLNDESSSERKCVFPTLTPLALMIVLGDMFHNFCDGVAMGAAFSSSTTVGISTSLAVFCHEFPHEVGDFAILIKSGLSKKWAVCLNGASALTCYLGAVIGMILGNSVGNAPMWIFAGVAGMFLYIALVDLIPEMTHIYLTPGKRWEVFLSLHAAGLITGSLFMLILGIYEHDIQMALG